MRKMLKTIHIVGVGLGLQYLGPASQKIVQNADVLAGGGRLLDYFAEHTGRKLKLTAKVDEWLEEVADAAVDERVVVIASGDPNFYGIAARLLERVGQENVRIHPNVTAVQAAFARLKESWAGVAVVSLHGRDKEALFSAIRENDRVAVFTDPTNTPVRIAELLMERGQIGWRMCVLENLGSNDSKVSFFRLHEAAGRRFDDLNIVVLWRKDEPAVLTLGTPDDEFVHEAGLITKAEVRAVALARLSLSRGMVLWDLGAGCGSVGLEAGLLIPGGRIIAVEKSPERVRQIEENRVKFGAANMEIVSGELPGVMEWLPDPDRIFIGGGGPVLGEIIKKGYECLPPGGVMVASAVKLDSVELARETMTSKGLDVEICQVQISRGKPLGGDHYLKALNPVWLVRGAKT